MSTKKKATKKATKRKEKKDRQLSETEILVDNRALHDVYYAYDSQRSQVSEEFPWDLFSETTTRAMHIVDLEKTPDHLRPFFLKVRLNNIDRKKLLTKVLGGDFSRAELLDKKCSSVREMSYIVQVAYDKQTDLAYNAEVKLMGRWYPVKFTFEYYESFFGPVMRFSSALRLSHDGETITLNTRVFDDTFLDNMGDPVTLSVREALLKSGLRPLDVVDQQALLNKALRAKQVGAVHGRQVNVNSNVLVKSNNWFGPPVEELKFGTSVLPRRAIIEPELELRDADSHDGDDDNNMATLPFVRLFSVDMKRYVYADVDDVSEYVHDHLALSKLVLPMNVMNLVRGLFESHNDEMFGDVLSFKHGGMIICAAGPTGVGKTMTAECFAEHTKRPLYPIELGELGTDLASIEDKLKIIFSRAQRWNAVLLLDEADVMFQKRDNDLERSAIVGVFLRLLDYYNGFLFLTTNRPETLDPAFESRITLTIKYPQLTKEARMKVWKGMLAAAKVVSPIRLETLASWPVNGRRIRSVVRLTKTLFKNRPLTDTAMMELLVNVLGPQPIEGAAEPFNTNGEQVTGDFAKGVS